MSDKNGSSKSEGIRSMTRLRTAHLSRASRTRWEFQVRRMW